MRAHRVAFSPRLRRSRLPRMHTDADHIEYALVAPDRHRASCTCSGWQLDRDVDLRDKRERMEVEAAFDEHQLQSVRG